MMQQSRTGLRQVSMMVEVDMEAMMRYLLSGLLILVAVAALLTAGSDNMTRASKEPPGDGAVAEQRSDIAEVVVTAERPARLMPEVVVSANLMPEVVVYATWSPAMVAAATPQASFVN